MLHSSIDTVAFVSNGVYSETYGAPHAEQIGLLFVSQGMVEDVPAYTPPMAAYAVRFKLDLLYTK